MRTKLTEPAERQEGANVCSQALHPYRVLEESGVAGELLHLQRTYGNHYVERFLHLAFMQATLNIINPPGDVHEQEADHVAEQVMRIPEVPMQKRPTASVHLTIDKYPGDDKLTSFDTLSVSSRRRPASDATSIASELPRSRGQPLDPETRAFFESRFGRDFTQVRIHTDTNAAESASRASAVAYTLGNHIIFGSARYAPNTYEGLKLIAHELTHTVQQGGVTPSEDPSYIRGKSLTEERDVIENKSGVHKTIEIRTYRQTPSPSLMLKRDENQPPSLYSIIAISKEIYDDVKKLYKTGRTSYEITTEIIERRPYLKDLSMYVATLVSHALGESAVVSKLQNLRQLPGSPGSIRASPGEIYRNIAERRDIARASQWGSKTLKEGLVAIPKAFQLLDGCTSLLEKDFDRAGASFSAAANVPGMDKLINNIISYAMEGKVNLQQIIEARDSLTMAATGGLTETINNVADAVYLIREKLGLGDMPPEKKRFRMDMSVLNDYREYIKLLRAGYKMYM